MASGNTLLTIRPNTAEFPASNYATIGQRNNHPTLDFDDTTQETAYFTAILPRNYAGGGITVYPHWAGKTATSGAVVWNISFERIGAAQQDIDSDGFASAQQFSASTADGTSGNVIVPSLGVSNGANMDSIAVGELFRIRVQRVPADGGDTMAGDAQLLGLELKET